MIMLSSNDLLWCEDCGAIASKTIKATDRVWIVPKLHKCVDDMEATMKFIQETKPEAPAPYVRCGATLECAPDAGYPSRAYSCGKDARHEGDHKCGDVTWR